MRQTFFQGIVLYFLIFDKQDHRRGIFVRNFVADLCAFTSITIFDSSQLIYVCDTYISAIRKTAQAKDKKTSDHSIDLVVGHGRRKVVGKAPRLGKVESNSLHIRGREDTCVTEVKRGRTTNNLPGTTTTNYTDTYENGLQYSSFNQRCIS